LASSTHHILKVAREVPVRTQQQESNWYWWLGRTIMLSFQRERGVWLRVSSFSQRLRVEALLAKYVHARQGLPEPKSAFQPGVLSASSPQQRHSWRAAFAACMKVSISIPPTSSSRSSLIAVRGVGGPAPQGQRGRGSRGEQDKYVLRACASVYFSGTCYGQPLMPSLCSRE
jgi:hypothetical protein